MQERKPPGFFAFVCFSLCLAFFFSGSAFAVTPEQKEALRQDGLSQIGSASSAAGVSGGLINSTIGSPEAMRSRLATPFTDNVPLRTLDGSQSGTVNSQCPKSPRFLNISYNEVSNGNINIIVRQDLDLDGVYDSGGTSFGDISGVCANGLAICQPGWNNCSYHKWTIEPNGTIGLTGAFYRDMGACICYSNSCASSSMTVFPHNETAMQQAILTDLGAGIISLLSQTVPDFRISDAVFGTKEVSFPGSNLKNCANKPNFAADPLINPDVITSSYGVGRNDSHLATISSNVMARDMANENSAWNAMLSMPSSTSSGNIKPCVIEHTITGKTTERFCDASGTWSFSQAVPLGDAVHGCGNTGISQVTFFLYARCLDTNNDGSGDTLYVYSYSTWQGHQGGNSWQTRYLNNVGYVSFLLTDKAPNIYYSLGSISVAWGNAILALGLSVSRVCNSSGNCHFSFRVHKINIECAWIDQSSFFLAWNTGANYRDEIEVLVSKNSCGNLETNSDCQIWNETVDDMLGICPINHQFESTLLKCINLNTGQIANTISASKTVSSGVIQSGVSLNSYGHRIFSSRTPGCMIYSGGRFNFICEASNGFINQTTGVNYPSATTPPFWRVSREYKCDAANPITINSDTWKRIDHITKTTDISGTTFTAEDAPTGGSISPMSAVLVGGAGAFNHNDGCSWRCKVQMAPIEDRQSTGGEQVPQSGVTSKGTPPGVTTITLTTTRECRKNNMLDVSEPWKCPYNPSAGETLIPINGLECSCMSDDFAKAATAMQFIRDMSEDLSCVP